MRRMIGLALVVALVVVACGDADSTTEGVASLESGATTIATETTVAEDFDQEQAMLALVACLREEGLDVADPEVDADGNVDLRGMFRQAGESGFDREEVEAAMTACSDLLEEVRLGFTAALDFTELQDQLLEYAACMRENGYDMPDPDVTRLGQGPGQGGPGGGGVFGEIDPDDPDFQLAQEACQDILGGFGPGGGPGLGGGRP